MMTADRSESVEAALRALQDEGYSTVTFVYGDLSRGELGFFWTTVGIDSFTDGSSLEVDGVSVPVCAGDVGGGYIAEPINGGGV